MITCFLVNIHEQTDSTHNTIVHNVQNERCYKIGSDPFQLTVTLFHLQHGTNDTYNSAQHKTSNSLSPNAQLQWWGQCILHQRPSPLCIVCVSIYYIS